MSTAHRGFLVVLTLIFGAIFLMILTAFMGFVINQTKVEEARAHQAQSLAIAEAGLNYYKWYLAHNPDDATNGTGEPGPYVIDYNDPASGITGTYTLSIATTSLCGDLTSITINSTGAVSDDPGSARTVYARYTRPTIAEYAYIINSNVWAGDDRTIIGPYHSNGVIRMDGTNNSIVTSGQETWTCDEDEMPCDPSNDGDTVDAIYGDGPGSDLWLFPQPPINFTGITVDLATIEDRAKNGGGLYLGPSGAQGYHIVLKSNGTLDLYKVKQKQNEPNGYAWGRQMNIIKSAQFLGNYTIPAACPVVFVEDQVWLDGAIGGKVALAAADVDTPGKDPSIILNDNITYANDDAGLLAIGEYDVLIGLVVPDDMTIHGIFIAQLGHFGRNYYDTSLPNAWDQYIERNSLTVNGTIVSNGREGTKWVCTTFWGQQYYCSGFETRYNYYDRDLVIDPPPLTPQTSNTYEFIEWREE